MTGHALLRGSRILLRPVERQDLELRVAWINDPEVQATLNFDYPTSLARTEKWFDRVLLDPTRRDFSVFTTDGDEYVGFAGLLNIEAWSRKAEMYATIGRRDCWRGGYGTESYRLLVNYGFVELGLHRLYAFQLGHNLAAHRIAEKLNWRREGLLRQDVFSHGKPSDRYIVAILRADWEDCRDVYGC